jgi:hypothetical protein
LHSCGGQIKLVEITPEPEPDPEPTLQVYPNPVKKGSPITIEGILKGVESLKIYDVNGRLIRTETLQGRDGASSVSTTTPLPSTDGIYIIKVGGETLKVVVE